MRKKYKITLKSLIFTVQMVCLFAGSSSAWVQEHFVIGTTNAPYLSGSTAADEARLNKFIDAHFNTVSGFGPKMSAAWNYPVYYHADTTDNFTQDTVYFIPRDVTNQYFISRLAAVNAAHGSAKLKALINDRDMFSGSFPSYSATGSGNYTALNGGASAALMGYLFRDEPNLPELSENLSKMAAMAAADTTRLFFENLFPFHARDIVGDTSNLSKWIWDGNLSSSWHKYDTGYVSRFIENPRTRVVAFDYYLIYNHFQNGNVVYSDYGTGRVTYYKSLDLFARRSGDAGKIFWGVPHAYEQNNLYRSVSNPDSVISSHYMTPLAERLRFGAFSNIIYGAKGLMWFGYGLPYDHHCLSDRGGACEDYIASAESDTSVYTDLQQINGSIKKMGPTLMRMRWLATVHGASTDPISGEPDLPIITEATPILTESSSLAEEFAVGIFSDTGDAKVHYLAVLNKDWTAGRYPSTLVLRGCRNLTLMDKTTGDFEPLSYTCSGNVTSLDLPMLQGGDMHLVKIAASTNPAAKVDYEGDGKADISVKSHSSTGLFHIDYSGDGFGTNTYAFENAQAIHYVWGNSSPEDIAAPADYDGDGLTDLAVKLADGTYGIDYASDGFVGGIYGWDFLYDEHASDWDEPACKPVPADYDGDGKADISVFCNNGGANSRWVIDFSYNGFSGVDAVVPLTTTFTSDHHAIPADYNGDGRADLAIHESYWGIWSIAYIDSSLTLQTWDGMFDDEAIEMWDYVVKAAPADYDGDGKADLAGMVADGYSGYWTIDYAANGFGGADTTFSQYITSDYVPVSSDYDGDGIADLSARVYGYDATWYIDYSANGFGSWDESFAGWDDGDNSQPLGKKTVASAEVEKAGGKIILSLTLPKASQVRVVAHALDGKQIATLFSGTLREGASKVSWNRDELSVKGLKRGVYFLSIQADNFRASKRLVLAE